MAATDGPVKKLPRSLLTASPYPTAPHLRGPAAQITPQQSSSTSPHGFWLSHILSTSPHIFSTLAHRAVSPCSTRSLQKARFALQCARAAPPAGAMRASAAAEGRQKISMKTFCKCGRLPGRPARELVGRPRVISLSPCSWHSVEVGETTEDRGRQSQQGLQL